MTTFVVTTPKRKSSEKLAQRLKLLGELEPLAGHPGRYLLTVGLAGTHPERALGEVRKLVGDAADVQPLLVDERGNPKIPTGKVNVRFKKAPSEEELRAFAEPLGLAIEKRNDYVPSQVSFRRADGAKESLDELVDRISKADDLVQLAWPETLGTYRRE